ncbi:TA system VapC family ribonuclease toxin, partial [Phytoactinopolyspora endophytica]|uniref:TA system VapC family ribonuclease toxin n=1 Tax=Phytoactinopolyspora endophytica TaxID=1642495 RepID=UPI00197BD4A9
ARHWLNEEIEHGWASCAITQNGVVRILSQPHYPSTVSPSESLTLLTNATKTEHHSYWPCSVSLTDDTVVDRTRIHGHRQVTDVYLLALATANDGRFVTFDTSIPRAAVHDATKDHLVIL